MNRVTMRAALSYLTLKRLVLALTIVFVLSIVSLSTAVAQGLCATVRIEIAQELTFERQAFDARLRIANSLDTLAIEDLSISILFTDSLGREVRSTTNPNESGAFFFQRIDSLRGVSNIAGTGTIPASSDAEIHWLIIPAAGAAGDSLTGIRYFVGAKVSYRVGGKLEEFDAPADFITVKPQPQLALDYFLTQVVEADEPFTPQIEESVPFTLGVRIQNTGKGIARNVAIESAQPKIVENELGLLIGFEITASYVDDRDAEKSLLINFGDIGSQQAKMGRWIMETNLSGMFTELSARFSHADELGGQLTSLLTRANAHFLVRDVLVDLPGRDRVRDFLAQDGSALTVYESNLVDTLVENLSALSSLVSRGSTGDVSIYDLTTPRAAGMLYVKLTDPFRGSAEITNVVRSDGKILARENAWVSHEGNGDARRFFMHLFDPHGGGNYRVEFSSNASRPRAPVLQFIPNRTRIEGQRLSFLVEAYDANGTIPALSIDQKPVGAAFIDRGTGTGIFDWPSQRGQSGHYPLTFRATDGQLTAARTATITLLPLVDTDHDGMPDDEERKYFTDLSQDADSDFDGDGISNGEEIENGTDPTDKTNAPGTPVVLSPALDSDVTTPRPLLRVLNASHDTRATTYEFEVFADAQFTQLVTGAPSVPEGTTTSEWTLDRDLLENTDYYWRVRAVQDAAPGEWAYGSFFVNASNSNPSAVFMLAPSDGTTVPTRQPVLSVSTTTDRDRNPLSYGFQLALSPSDQNLINAHYGIPGNASSANWTVSPALTEDQSYYARGVATDSLGASSFTAWTSFHVNEDDNAPPAPPILTPTNEEELRTTTATLRAGAVSDPEGGSVWYSFELDTTPNFQSGAVIRSGLLTAAGGAATFPVAGLTENVRYFWRVRATDGRTESAWSTASFFINQQNDAPSTPTVRNPGEGAWLQTATPTLSVNPAIDPEGGALRYRFELYSDQILSTLVWSGISDTESLTISPALEDHKRYFWRAQAIDSEGLTSNGWSQVSSFVVSLDGTNSPPQIALQPRAAVVEATASSSITITWDDADPDSDAMISLYANGVPIATNISEDPDGAADSFVWNTFGIPAGNYAIGAYITDGVTTNFSSTWFTIRLLPVIVDTDGDTIPDAKDNCPYTPNRDQRDRGGVYTKLKDGIGDACQCGDVNGDGRITSADVKMITDSLNKRKKVKLRKPLLCQVAGNTKCDKSDATALSKSIAAETANQKKKKKNTFIAIAKKLQRCSPARKP